MRGNRVPGAQQSVRTSDGDFLKLQTLDVRSPTLPSEDGRSWGFHREPTRRGSIRSLPSRRMDLFASAGIDLPPSGGRRSGKAVAPRSLRTPLFAHKVIEDAIGRSPRAR